jgi:hypothetical protein
MDSRVRGLPKSLRCNYGTDLGEAKQPARPEIVPCRAFSKAVFVEYQPFRSVPDFLEIPLCGNDGFGRAYSEVSVLRTTAIQRIGPRASS